MTRRLTIIESPFAARDGRSVEDNLEYLGRCLRDSWDKGELPFASHAFFPTFLDEDLPEERKAGIEAGYEFWSFHQLMDDQFPLIAFYVDFGMSDGMQQALDRAKKLDRTYELRNIKGA